MQKVLIRSTSIAIALVFLAYGVFGDKYEDGPLFLFRLLYYIMRPEEWYKSRFLSSQTEVKNT